MSFSDEIRGERAPDYLQRFAARVGGKTPYGHPRYRVVLAQTVFHKAHGEFYDWDEDTTVSERGGIELTEDGWKKSRTSPIRVVVETRWVPTYPDIEGWLIERWYPSLMFGTEENWSQYPLLGPYPHNGRYVDCCKAIKRMPTLDQVEGVIQAIEYKIQNKQGTMQERINKRYREILAAREAKRRQIRNLTINMMHDRTSVIFGSSLAAGRIREDIASRIRARGGRIGHVGN